jgi:hypothetical protein
MLRETSDERNVADVPEREKPDLRVAAVRDSIRS